MLSSVRDMGQPRCLIRTLRCLSDLPSALTTAYVVLPSCPFHQVCAPKHGISCCSNRDNFHHQQCHLLSQIPTSMHRSLHNDHPENGPPSIPMRSATSSHFFLRQSQKETKVPHRHAAPSAPWPWIDIHDTVDPEQLASTLPPIPELCDHKSCNGCWTEYPQSRFPNWTRDQVTRSKITQAIAKRKGSCIIFQADVRADGIFRDVKSVTATENTNEASWNTIIHTARPPHIRVRALFVKNMSGPILQMLGARYNIEPFFFSSSLNRIPSRYQEEIQHHEGDHITVVLTFLKSIPRQARSDRASQTSSSVHPPGILSYSKQMVDTQEPLWLSFNDRQLILDLLSVHLIRHVDGSTIISFHPEVTGSMTSAEYLHERIRFAGQSVYWQKIFQDSPDPTFLLLTFVWHAMYAWDEALEDLYAHIGQLETRVLSTSNMKLTQELHVIRAHQLHYSSLLDDFRKTVEFIRATRNPAMDSFPEAIRMRSAELMERECSNLKNEIDRLDTSRKVLDKQLKNVMNLVFSSVNIKMTEAAVKDSAAMKQVAFLTMIFLPASFIATVFGMNVKEIAGDTTRETLGRYAAVAVTFTAASVWIIIAFQSRHLFDEDIGFWEGFGWPYILFRKLLRNSLKTNELDPEAKNV